MGVPGLGSVARGVDSTTFPCAALAGPGALSAQRSRACCVATSVLVESAASRSNIPVAFSVSPRFISDGESVLADEQAGPAGRGAREELDGAGRQTAEWGNLLPVGIERTEG
jgi:hypothetical protein